MFLFPNKPTRHYNPKSLVPLLEPAQDWVVQPKWDGKRVLIECDALGVVRFYGRLGQNFAGAWGWLRDLPLPKPWFLDGEWLRDGRIILWDIGILDGIKVCKDPYGGRLEVLQKAIPESLTLFGQTLQCVETYPADQYQEHILDRKGVTGLEGCVWKNLKATNLWGIVSTSEVNSCFKYRFR